MIGRPFKKGESGNPGGRPHTTEFSQAIREYLATPLTNRHDKTRLEALIERLYKKDPKTLLAYGFGKPAQTFELGKTPGHVVFIPLRVDPDTITGKNEP